MPYVFIWERFFRTVRKTSKQKHRSISKTRPIVKKSRFTKLFFYTWLFWLNFNKKNIKTKKFVYSFFLFPYNNTHSYPSLSNTAHTYLQKSLSIYNSYFLNFYLTLGLTRYAYRSINVPSDIWQLKKLKNLRYVHSTLSQ